MNKFSSIFILAALSLNTAIAQQQKITPAQQKMNTFINSLMAKMTLDEKIGQMNLPSSGDITTGQANSSDISKKIIAST